MEAIIYEGAKIVSSTSGVRKAGQLHVNQWNMNTSSHYIPKRKNSLYT